MLEFCEIENIPVVKCWYYLNSKGEKKPLGEKNNLTTEDIKTHKPISKPTKKYDDKTKKYIELTKDEQKSLTEVYSLFLKHTDNMYCIDVDDPEVNNIDDFLKMLDFFKSLKSSEKKHLEKFKNIIKNSAWTSGNTKGIHIYVKFKNVPTYTNQIDVYKYFLGDFIRKNNMWETITKKINNFRGELSEIYEFDDISHMFNEKVKHTKLETKNTKTDTKNTKNRKYIETDDETDDETSSVSIGEEYNKCNEEIELYIKYGLVHKIFKKMRGYENWLKIGFIIKNELINNEDGGSYWFHKVSQHYESEKYDSYGCETFFNSLNSIVKNTEKKPLTFKSLIKLYKDTDSEIFKKIIKDVKEDKKGLGQTQIFPDDKTKNFDTNYFCSLGSYSLKKQYFEIFVCKVLRPQPLFVYSENDNNKLNCLLYSEEDIIKTFKHLKSSIYDENKRTGECVETLFTKEWLSDSKIRHYNNMDFLPYNGVRNIADNNKDKSKTFNLFNGYNPYINLELDETYTEERKDKILKPFLDLVKHLTGNEDKCFKFFINFFAHLIQKPSERIPICLIIKSKQGIGKNLTLDTIGSIINKYHYITSSNPKDFFGDYAEGFYRKLLVNMNECEGKDTFDFEGKVKSFISEDTITLNPKFVRQTTISNFARVIITTNKPNPIPIDVRSKDRRYVVNQSTEEYLKPKYGEVFWSKLVEHFKKPEFIKILYDYFNSIDISKIKWKEERPITQAYLDMCKLYIPVECLFLENWIENKRYRNNENCFIDDDDSDDDTDDDISNNKNSTKLYNSRFEIKTVKFYQQYVEYCKLCGFINDKSFQPNINKFTGRLTELELSILKTTTSVTSVFRFTPKNVYDIMVKKNWIAKNENTEEIKEEKGEDFDDYFDC